VLIGVISDTHGSLDPGVHDVFRGVSRIVHAGDVGSVSVLDELGAIAPVDAVVGNTDVHGACSALPEVRTIVVEGVRVLVVHDARPYLRAGLPEGVTVVVHGHTHLPEVLVAEGVTYVNPGSASVPRGGHGPSVALIEIAGDRREARLRFL
jgi:putative phosphoesterase